MWVLGKLPSVERTKVKRTEIADVRKLFDLETGECKHQEQFAPLVSHCFACPFAIGGLQGFTPTIHPATGT
jgi:hypothetical protein